MYLNDTILSVYTIIKLVVAVGLFSRSLPLRSRPSLRIALTLTVILLASAVALGAGFSVFPALTDNLSFVWAIATFMAILAIAVVAQMYVFDCTIWTSLFCCSMSYSLVSFSSEADRVWDTLWPNKPHPTPLLEGSLTYWFTAILVFAIVYQLLIRRIEKRALLAIKSPVMVIPAALAILVNMVLDLVVKDLCALDVPARYQQALVWIYLLLCVYLMFANFEIVYNQRLKIDMATTERLRATEAKQYQLSRENIEAINLKVHDIKHQIRHLDGYEVVDGHVLESISHEVDIYDSAIKSGNDALDTILTEKGLLCEKHGITLSCIADGQALDFMEPVDLYSFFGNALDNAIEAVDTLDDPERRSISLIVRRAGDMASIHVENYFAGNVRLGDDGLPLTSKGDALNHGFGTQSMRMVVERYGGSLSVRAQEDVFHLNAIVMLPA